jgi:hypothetical protein
LLSATIQKSSSENGRRKHGKSSTKGDKARSDIAKDDDFPSYVSDDDSPPVQTPRDDFPAYILDDDVKPSAQKYVLKTSVELKKGRRSSTRDIGCEDSKCNDEQIMVRDRASANRVKRHI